MSRKDGETLTQVDADGRILGTRSAEDEASSFLVDGDGSFWVHDEEHGRLTHVAKSNKPLSDTKVGKGPSSLTFRPDNQICIALRDANSVRVLDASGRVVTSFDVGRRPTGIACDFSGRLWTANEGDGSVSVITLNGLVSTYPIGGKPTAIAASADGYVYVLDRLAGEMKVLAQ